MPDPYQAWANQLLQVVLTSWRERADSPDGLFNPYLDRQWRHTSDGPRTLVSQCRLIYNFARAFELGGDPGYADLVQRGIAALERNFGDPDGDGWVWACHGDGRLADDTGDAYGHAFVILALATAAAGLGEARHRDLALRTWDAVQRRFRDRHGGLLWHVDRAGRALDDARSQNPLMHTFEALLVLATLDGAGAARQDAREIWAFLRSRMLGPGILPEWYTPDWQPVASGPRSIVDVGHAFEWAFLLSEAQELFPDDDLLGPGRDFLAFGLRHGYDAAEGGIVSPVDFAGRPRDGRKGWWEQCEAIRAMRRYVVRHGAAEAEIPLARSIDFAQRHFVDEEFGGWYEGPFGAGATPSFEKGNAWKLDYHVVNMCRELAAGEG